MLGLVAVAIAVVVLLHHLEPKLVAPLIDYLERQGVLPHQLLAAPVDPAAKLPVEEPAAAATFVGKKKKAKKASAKPKSQPKVPLPESEEDSDSEEELQPTRKSGKVSVYRGGPVGAKRSASPAASDESFELVSPPAPPSDLGSEGLEWAEDEDGWGTIDTKKRADMKKAVKVKAAKEAEKNRPAGAVGEDGLTYKQRQNRKRAEKKKAERDTVNQLKKQANKPTGTFTQGGYSYQKAAA